MSKQTQTLFKLAYYLREGENTHYFAALKPYLDYFKQQSHISNHIVVRQLNDSINELPDYKNYQHYFCDTPLSSYFDLVITPTYLRLEDSAGPTTTVQIFHGMSDKPFTYDRDFSSYELCLCAGQRQIDRLLRNPINKNMRCEIIGYPKFDAIKPMPKLFDNDKQTLIYCPTWRKQDASSIDIFLQAKGAVQQLIRQYNVILKPHPNTFSRSRQSFDADLLNRLYRLEALGDLKLVRAGNVMPWMSQADIYLGDISASGYEWLYFDKPMVFINPQPNTMQPSTDVDAWTYLWQCGEVCNQMTELVAVVNKNLEKDNFKAQRREILAYSVHKAHRQQATNKGIGAIETVIARITKAKKNSLYQLSS